MVVEKAEAVVGMGKQETRVTDESNYTTIHYGYLYIFTDSGYRICYT